MAIVRDKDAVSIDSMSEEDGLLFTVKVAPDDMGRIIGRKGRIVSALRTVVRAAAGETKISVEISEL